MADETSSGADAPVTPISNTPTALAKRAPREVVLMPVMDVALAKRRLEELQEFCAGYLQESADGGNDGGDYGAIPGAGKKKVLLKSGADKLCDVYGLADRYHILSKVEDFAQGLFDYTMECELVRKTDEMFVGTGLGSCSSWETKYRWREAKRVCPQCGEPAIIKGKAEYGGGWLCWAKKGGCGAKFADSDPAISDQTLGRVENPDIADTKNTVLKMAKKRAKIDAVIGVTRSAGIFTQDLAEVDDAPIVATGVTTEVEKLHALAAKDVASAVETHAQKIARVKAAAAKQQHAAPPVSAPPVEEAQEPEVLAAETEPEQAPAEPEAVAVAMPNGAVQVVSINVRNGPMVLKNGKSVPSWGPLYVVAFDRKVKASDGVSVIDATTFDEKIAQAAEEARDGKTAVTPVVVQGKKRGSYNLESL